LNVSKVYLELRKLNGLGLVEVESGRGKSYRLSDDDLKSVVSKLSPRVMSLGRWKSKESKAWRFRMGMQAVPEFRVEGEGALVKPTRLSGELTVLATLGRRKFDSKYRRTGSREIASQ
jgi:hypothetical protein